MLAPTHEAPTNETPGAAVFAQGFEAVGFMENSAQAPEKQP